LTLNPSKGLKEKDLEIFLLYDDKGKVLRYDDGRLVFEFRYKCHDGERIHENIHYCVDMIVKSKD
jgi:hypothetical protein